MGLASGNIDKSFREQNSIVCARSEFAQIYEENELEVADKIMWAIFLIEEPDQDVNPYAKKRREDRIKEVLADFYPLDTEKYGPAMKAYSRWCISFEEQLFKIQKRKLDELTTYFDDLKLQNDMDFDKYLKISDKLNKIWTNFEAAEKRIIDSKKKTNITTHGDQKLSRSELRRQGRS
jgi:hypothetical protein